MAIVSKPFKGTITLPADTNIHRLSDCLKAVSGAGTGGAADAATRYVGWTLTADTGNAGTIFIGGSDVTTAIYARNLAAGITWTVTSTSANPIAVNDYWVLGSANSQKFHFEGVRAN